MFKFKTTYQKTKGGLKKKSKTVVACLLVTALLCGCNSGKGNPSFLENVPDPEAYFSGSACSEYSMEELDLKGVSIEYSGNDIRDAFESYVEECEAIGFWVIPVYNGSDSWCYQNEDGTLQIAINLYESANKIDVCVKTLKE